MARISIHDSMPIEKLAMHYALIQETLHTADATEKDIDYAWDLKQRIFGRCGMENGLVRIQQAVDTLKLLGD